ncbi:MAG TPA: hypothetical protein VKL99_09855 [Candidatus Angelobacter sp.]|nr:hypothetical protein [Candidatus Angelobacter sp.]
MRKPLIHSFIAVYLLFATLGFARNAGPAQSQPTATPAQSPSTPATPATPAPAAAPAPSPVSPLAQPSPSPAQPLPPPAQPSATPSHRLEIEPVEQEHKITPVEAKELFRSMDEILRFASQDTGLPIKKKVKRTIVSRAQVEKYIGDKFKDDADRIRFERSELVQKKFGLLPREFDLHAFLIKLLAEQVAGYYDEKTRTMNLLDWNEPDMQRPVMAHELTHALQDQSYNLEKMSRHEEEIEKKGMEDLEALVRNDEESTCRSAVLEGQAMIVLLDYVLAPSEQSVAKMPGVVDVMQSSMDKSRGSPIFDSAPLLLQEELAFPYRQGMKFIKDLLVAGGKQLAYKGVLERLPQTTREVMEPKEYLAGHRVPPLLLPDFSFLKKDYEPFDAGAVGELDVSILLRVYADAEVAKKLTPEWRGGSYYAVGRKGARPPDRNSTAHIGLYYVSKWATEAAAREFAAVYADALSKRYKELRRVHGYAPEILQWASSDGPISIRQTGDRVIAVESFEEETAKRLMEAGVKETVKAAGR